MTTPAGAVAGNAQAAQSDAEQRERAQPKGGGFFGRKYGPLKGWQWSVAAGGLGLIYFWWRSRQRAATTAATGTGTGTGYAGQIAALQQEIDQLQGGSSFTTTGGQPPPTTGTSTTSTHHETVTVPKVTGMEVDAAQRVLVSTGLKATHPPLKTGHGYTVTGQVPAGGKRAAKGSTVALTIKQNAKGG